MRTKQECFHNATSIIFTSKNFPLYAGGFKFKNSWSRIARNRTVIENKDIFWCPKNPQGKKNELLDLLIQKSKIFNPGAAGCHQMVAYTFQLTITLLQYFFLSLQNSCKLIKFLSLLKYLVKIFMTFPELESRS